MPIAAPAFAGATPCSDQRLKQPDQRLVGGRHVEAVQLGRPHPAKRARMLRDRRSMPFAAYVKQEQQMPVTEHVARKAGRREAEIGRASCREKVCPSV